MKTAIIGILVFLLGSCTGSKGSSDTASPKEAVTPAPREKAAVTPAPATVVAPIPAKFAASATTYVPPKTRPGDGGWIDYVDAPVYDAKSSVGVAPGFATPEAAVVHFYTSRIRKDDLWKKALVTEGLVVGTKTVTERNLKRLTRKLKKMNTWTFISFSLVKKKEKEGEIYIKIEMTIEYRGRQKTGKDEATVIKSGDRYYLISVPT
ncbi:hypothetical protein KKF84_02710 [Myxococcota bacterium]|nr:hypothetical protein [Myxococcota bacterium]